MILENQPVFALRCEKSVFDRTTIFIEFVKTLNGRISKFRLLQYSEVSLIQFYELYCNTITYCQILLNPIKWVTPLACARKKTSARTLCRLQRQGVFSYFSQLSKFSSRSSHIAVKDTMETLANNLSINDGQERP